MIPQAAMQVEVYEDEAEFDRAEVSAPNEIKQAGAICLRRKNGQERVEILLIGSLRNGRWGIPKGHIEPGETSRDTAEREAFEEAGIKGTATERVLGSFAYTKEGSPFRYCVAVHLLVATDIASDFPEKDRRKTKWVPIDVAHREIAQTPLGQIIRDLF
ncbi:NUDIX hydrolase [Neorhizobium alkalisoli]|uniref:NUDIX hydrolase n=1 Tax=Neorhizobium alkalisoli TaxID=528178 RepID=UPI001FE1B4C0|nr:NUDIX hydrolase [Neorhizobium alkalisoli]